MISNGSSLPVCSACGSRAVLIIHRPASDFRNLKPSIRGPICTFFACQGCGRDLTSAWAPIQPRTLQ